MIHDNIADILTRIRNANLVKNKNVILPYTRISWQIIKILEKQGFISSFLLINDHNKIQLKINLKYKNQKPLIHNLTRISRPGRRIFVNKKRIPNILGGLGILILSTDRGIISDREARFYKIGGELLCSIY
uniref:Small ribosomal subunit protein uS8c n=1 Tax=Dichotomosiphon tuberosus TaxID=118263 RepID=A0A386AWZ4_9CHLO|nr:ribosomal protein S8 [Dichotomosiphon tuberosus]